MNEKELKRLKELKTKSIDSLTDDEKHELDSLTEKKETYDLVKQAASDFFKTSGLTEVVKKHPDTERIGESPEGRFALLLKGIYSGNYDLITKAADPMVVGTPGSGGYLVPQLTASRIVELVPTFGQARRHMTVFPMAGNELLIPKENAMPSWNWINEGASITSSKPTVQTIALTPKKGAAIVVLSNELLKDANINIAGYVMGKIAQAKGTSEDAQMFAGTGSPFTGIYNPSNPFGYAEPTATTTAASLIYQDLLNAIAGIDQNFLTGAAWYFHRTILPVVAGLTDDNERPLLEPAFGDLPMRLLGFPVRLIENAPSLSSVTGGKPFVILGNLENSYIGDVQGMEVTLLSEATIDGTSLGQYDLSAIRVISRVAFNKGLTEKYSV
ncbi:MAG TPA: phage major capsid protein, partial [Ignavibacteria bacterium]|nr:phage major capsid protein [Ignavibacteria bacterium]